MGHSLCSFILRQIPRRSPTHNAVYFTTTRLGGYSDHGNQLVAQDEGDDDTSDGDYHVFG